VVYLLHIAGRTEIPEKYKSLSNSTDDRYRGHLHSSSLLENFYLHSWLNTQSKKPITQSNSEQAQFNPDHKNLFSFDLLHYYNDVLTKISCSSSQFLQAHVSISNEAAGAPTSFPIHYSLAILPYDTRQYETQTVLLSQTLNK
jgi:hypothetical protein